MTGCPPKGGPSTPTRPPTTGSASRPLEVPEGYADDGGYPDYDLYDEPADPNPLPAWPRPRHHPSPRPDPHRLARPARPAPAAAEDNAGRPAPGLLELTMPWSALAQRSASPATLTRIGPITAEQARLLAAVAATTPATRWRVILTDPHGHALAVTTIPRHATRPHSQPRPATGLTGRITITMPITALDAPPPPDGHPLLPAIATAAARALARLQHDLQSTEPEPSDPLRPARATLASPTRPAQHRNDRRMRASRRHRWLPAHHGHPRLRHRPRPDLPLPLLPPARLARRPRPHPPLAQGRPDLPLQSRRPVPHPPHPQATPGLDPDPAPPRRLPLDHPHRPHLHMRTRHPPQLAQWLHRQRQGISVVLATPEISGNAMARPIRWRANEPRSRCPGVS